VKEILIYLLLALALIAGVVVAATTPAFARTPASSTLLLQEMQLTSLRRLFCRQNFFRNVDTILAAWYV